MTNFEFRRKKASKDIYLHYKIGRRKKLLKKGYYLTQVRDNAILNIFDECVVILCTSTNTLAYQNRLLSFSI